MVSVERELPPYKAQHNLGEVPQEPASEPGREADVLTGESHHQRLRRYRQARRLIDSLAADDVRLVRLARDAEPARYPSSSAEGARGPGLSDPTAAAALQAWADPAGRALEHFEQAARHLRWAAMLRNRALNIEAAEGPALEEALKKLAVEQEAAGIPEDACPSCKRAAIFSPSGDAKDVGQDNPLCQWCHRFVRNYGQWPARDLVRKYHQQGRVSVRDIERSLRAAQPDKPHQ